MLDTESGAVKSIFDKELNKELVNAASPYRFDQYLYVTGGDQSPNRLLEYSSTWPIPELTIHNAGGGRMVSMTREPFGGRASGKLGCEHPEDRDGNDPVDGQKKIEFINHVHKTEVYTKEAVYFAFPLAMDQPQFRYEIQNGFVNPAHDQMPGAGKEWFSVQHWVAADQDGVTVRPGLYARNNPFHPAPARGAVIKFLVAAHLGRLGTRIEAGLGAFLQGFNMAAQGCGWRGAQDEIEAVGPAEIDDLGAAIMAVAADQDLRGGPIGPDGAEQAAQERADFHATGTLGRTQHGGYEPPVPVEDHDRLEAVLVIMRVEQTELLAAVDGVERVIEIEHDPLGHGGVRRAIEIDERLLHAQQRADIRQIFQARDGRLRGQIRAGRQNALRQLESRIGPERRGVVAILVAAGNHEHPELDRIRKSMKDLVLIPGIVDTDRQALSEAQTLRNLPQQQNTPVR